MLNKDIVSFLFCQNYTFLFKAGIYQILQDTVLCSGCTFSFQDAVFLKKPHPRMRVGNPGTKYEWALGEPSFVSKGGHFLFIFLK